MNRKILVLGALCGLALVGCNGFGSGEGKFAQVDNETVYNTDIDFPKEIDEIGGEMQ